MQGGDRLYFFGLSVHGRREYHAAGHRERSHLHQHRQCPHPGERYTA
ncbi:hypothetical protein EVA_20844 [gut metagenome]|uniref:Uncharacterized protein n=1 Tax=gut metagenome TaxID=749906 RepID=J9BU42_9ZZZZ